jgi:nucleoside-diphosphate-sugar epimerase
VLASRNKAVVAGGLGVVGRSVLEHLEHRADWDIVALSRRKPDFATRAEIVAVDLTDPASCRDGLGTVKGVTHVVYAALHEQASIVKGWQESDHVRVNLQMLTNFLDAVEDASPSLRHITLMQGGKAYGVHLGPQRRIPSKETDPRTMPPNFYYDQEDFIRRRQAGKSWAWTVLRPPSVCGFTVGSPMNTLLAIGVFAAVCRELGLPLRFPGAEGHLIETCDARLLSKAIVWAGESPAARNEIFNVANGDCFMWEHLWPRFAEVFGMECAPPHTLSLARAMPDKGEVWDRIVQKYGLRPYRFEQLVPSWDFTDFLFRYGRPPYPSLMSTIKVRQAGFHDSADSERMFVELLRDLQAKKILPP